ncbi:armadillo-type protein, partial [Dioszegia hungarica]
MSPAAESTGVSAKAGAFDTASLFVADKAASAEAANTVATLAKKEGVEFFGAIKLNEALVQALNDNKNPATREAACAAISTICEQGAGQLLEPYIISSDANAPFSILLETFADKEKAVKDAAIAAVKAIVQVMNPWATAVILPAILEQVKTAGKWQVKTGCLEVLQQLITSAPNQVGQATQDLISILAGAVRDTKWDVRKAVKVTLECATKLVDNKDIEQLIPALIKSLLNPIEELPKTITLLSATTFISEVTAPAMSLIAPLLVRGLDHPSAAVKRKVCVIADNMSKLVDSEYTVRPFLPQLLPRLIKMGETMGDPEACLICNRAVATLRRIGRVPEGSDGTNLPPLKIAEGPHITTNLVALVKTNGGAIVEQVNPALAYAGVLAASLVNAHNFDQDTWQDELVPYMELALPGVNSLLAVGKLLQKKADEAERGHVKYPDEEEGEDLCNIEHFDLASSTRLLLYNANIRLKRGHHYGLCGRNGLDKSAFLSALGDAQLINSRSNLAVRTFYVQQDVDESMSILDSVLLDKRLQASEQEIRRNLQSVGLNVVLQSHSVGSLSAENKMRLGLARAVLSKADIILLDEPTNHLDVLNVDWVVNYLTSLTTCTSIIVSHDSDFLNRTITDVLYLNNFKLNRYPGGLHAFAREVPAVRGFLRL